MYIQDRFYLFKESKFLVFVQTYIKSEIFYVGLHCFIKYESSMHNLIRHIVKALTTLVCYS